MSVVKIRPAAFLEKEESDKAGEKALLILNQPIVNGSVFEKVWHYSTLRVCADGGANRLYDYFGNDEDKRKTYLPDCITGDLDSLKDSTRQYYSSLGVPIIGNPDQYSTDFDKAADFVVSKLGPTAPIISVGSMGGRVDQSLSSIHRLFVSHEKNQPLSLLSDKNVTILLMPGTSRISTPLTHLGNTCGIIPIVGPAHITTKGLKWDVENWETKLGGQLSTSNQLMKDEIEITTDSPVVFTAELRQEE
jgi:thiamine pyrophosphokinase